MRAYRKTALTLVSGPYQPPVEVDTQEGNELISDSPAYIAVDSEGWPYPIKASVFHATYEPADES